ncbi:MAG: hypothetical protein ACI9VT_004189, partial [Psychroserpens sp.]
EAKKKKLNQIKSRRSYKTYIGIGVMAVFIAIRMFERYA